LSAAWISVPRCSLSDFESPAFVPMQLLFLGREFSCLCGTMHFDRAFSRGNDTGGEKMKKYLLAAAMTCAIAAPALADDVGVRVGPVGAGVTVGESPAYRDRDRDRTTVIKEREPRDKTTVIKKENEDGVRSKTVIHDHD
jgi:hypothetical protein